MALVEINVPELKCKKCKGKWLPRPKQDNIVMKGKKQFLRVDRCPHCKSTRWDE